VREWLWCPKKGEKWLFSTHFSPQIWLYSK
jgi:hypothetical protein